MRTVSRYVEYFSCATIRNLLDSNKFLIVENIERVRGYDSHKFKTIQHSLIKIHCYFHLELVFVLVTHEPCKRGKN